MSPSHISVEPCTIPPGPQVSTSRDPLEMFLHFFDDDILSLIVRETNRFAAQCLAAANSSATWETNLAEIKAYLGFMVVMGVNRLPEIRDYWSLDPMLNNAFISSRITRKRFEEISRYIHFVDNTTLPLRDEPGFHRLQKVMPIITALREKFEGNYHPHPQNSVDEAMIPFKGLYSMCACIQIDICYNNIFVRCCFVHVHVNIHKFMHVTSKALTCTCTCIYMAIYPNHNIEAEYMHGPKCTCTV